MLLFLPHPHCCVYALLYADVVHALDYCSKNYLCKERVKAAIILMHEADFPPFPAHLSLLKDKQQITIWSYTLRGVRQHLSASKFSRSPARKCILQLHRAFTDLPGSQAIFLYSSGKFLQLFVSENTREQIDTFLYTLPSCLIDACSYF